MRPVLGSMPSPGGRPVAVQVSGEPLASAPCIGSENGAPSVTYCVPGSVTATAVATDQTNAW